MHQVIEPYLIRLFKFHTVCNATLNSSTICSLSIFMVFVGLIGTFRWFIRLARVELRRWGMCHWTCLVLFLPATHDLSGYTEWWKTEILRSLGFTGYFSGLGWL